MTDLLAWAGIAQGLLTPVIALVVAWIAYQQWQTAKGNLMLNLFDKRLAVYHQIGRAVRVVNIHAKPDEAAMRDLLEAKAEAEFLFDEDIHRYLDQMWLDFIELQAAHAMIKDVGDDQRPALVDKLMKLPLKIGNFYYEGPDRFARYMRMDQARGKAPTKVRSRPTSA